MVSTTSVSIHDELSEADAVELSQDIQRMIRRARAMKPAESKLERSMDNIMDVFGSMIPPTEELSFDRLRELASDNRPLALQCIRPLTGFFYSNGLLPNSVKKDALLAYVLLQTAELRDERTASPQ